MKITSPAAIFGPLARRDLVAIFAYVNCNRPMARPVDACAEIVQSRLDRLAAAARMQ
jgi:hypothetical protein